MKRSQEYDIIRLAAEHRGEGKRKRGRPRKRKRGRPRKRKRGRPRKRKRGRPRKRKRGRPRKRKRGRPRKRWMDCIREDASWLPVRKHEWA